MSTCKVPLSLVDRLLSMHSQLNDLWMRILRVINWINAGIIFFVLCLMPHHFFSTRCWVNAVKYSWHIRMTMMSVCVGAIFIVNYHSRVKKKQIFLVHLNIFLQSERTHIQGRQEHRKLDNKMINIEFMWVNIQQRKKF